MLIAFFKSHEDKDCDCEIAKFVDRIWIEESGAIKCIRTFIIYVRKDSPKPLTDIRMLMPFHQTPELYCISDTCLNESYLFNKSQFSTGGSSKPLRGS